VEGAVLVIVLFKVLVDCVEVLSPVVLALSVALQVYVAGILLDNGIFTADPLQIVAVPELVIAGAGLTVATTLIGLPTHPAPEVGVTV
jgi:hypothetical protein